MKYRIPMPGVFAAKSAPTDPSFPRKRESIASGLCVRQPLVKAALSTWQTHNSMEMDSSELCLGQVRALIMY